ncbi:helix-turn-helix domain-containing protein [Winogradskyella wichelsiae]|uniref:helix-turn-helix domain-containing protein n=1 Tax=Winogradskyella wichelsiae TaxID=2697007 RepID=UPI003EF4F157
MSKEHWKNKIQIVDDFESDTASLSVNSMGVYFKFIEENKVIVHFKPLNEVFDTTIFNSNHGVLLNFERELIDEDDIEYALDVMFLFNKYPELEIKDAKEVVLLRQIINLIKNEFYSELASYIMLKTLLKVLLLHLIRSQKDDFLKQDLHQKRVFQFLELMEANFLNETNPHFYAEEIGMSTKRLNQILKEKLNLTAKQIIQQRQITEAKRRLIKSEISTKELAFDLGFSSMSSFSRFFKQYVGVSPSGFKKQH